MSHNENEFVSDTIATAAGNLVNAFNATVPALTGNAIAAWNFDGVNTFYIRTTIDGASPRSTSFSTSIQSSGTETVVFQGNVDESTNATIGGTVTTGDVTSITIDNAALPGGEKTISYTSVAGNTTTTIATALKNAINADTNLQAIGLTADSSGAVITLQTYTNYTASVSGSATETVTLANGNRGTILATIGGKPTTGDVVSINVRNASLSGGVKTISYTVVANDTPLSIAQGLTAAINADATLQTLGVTAANSARLDWSQSFTGNGILPPGTSGAAASAVDGSSNTKSSIYQLSVNGGSASSLVFDLNGNMTSDGTNTFDWDAENRLSKISYPGLNNFSSFAYDSFSRNTKIVETTSGVATSTLQFLWTKFDRGEIRDAVGAVVKRFFDQGQLNSGSKYFYAVDHLGSVSTVSDNSGTVQATYFYDAYGRRSKILENTASDFGFSGTYLRGRSDLYLMPFRQYSSQLGRWLSRDPAGETSGANLLEYAMNDPTMFTDLSGRTPSADPGKGKNPKNPNNSSPWGTNPGWGNAPGWGTSPGWGNGPGWGTAPGWGTCNPWRGAEPPKPEPLTPEPSNATSPTILCYMMCYTWFWPLVLVCNRMPTPGMRMVCLAGAIAQLRWCIYWCNVVTPSPN